MDFSGWDEVIPSHEYANELHQAYLVFGILLLIYGVSALIFTEKLFINEAILSLFVGILLGPHFLQQLRPRYYFGQNYDQILLEISRFIVGLNCINVGIQLPKKYIWTNRFDMAMMLGPIMTAMFVIASLGVYLIMGYSITNSLILGAILTPTDPVLVSSVLNGEFAESYIPKRIQHLLAAESAANDALGFCFLYLPFYFSRITPIGDALGLFVLHVILYNIVLAAILGLGLGYATSKILKFATKRKLIERKSVLCVLLALAMVVIGSMTRLGIDEIVGCLFAGAGLACDEWFVDVMEASELTDILDTMINTGYFLLIGAIVPISSFPQIGYGKLLCLAAWIIFLRRLPFMMLIHRFIPSTSEKRTDGLLAGWFAPIGGGAILYTQICGELKTEMQDDLLAIVLFIVCTCIIIQGGSIPLFERYLPELVPHHQERFKLVLAPESDEEKLGSDSTTFEDELSSESSIHEEKASSIILIK